MPRPDQPVARLVWVLDGEVRFAPHRGPNRLAADRLVDHVRSLDMVSAADEAHATAAAMLGEAVDADPTNAALWGQYRQALDAVKGLGATGDDDTFARLLAELGAAEVRHTAEPQSPDSGRSDRKGRPGSRSAADASPGSGC